MRYAIISSALVALASAVTSAAPCSIFSIEAPCEHCEPELHIDPRMDMMTLKIKRTGDIASAATVDYTIDPPNEAPTGTLAFPAGVDTRTLAFELPPAPSGSPPGWFSFSLGLLKPSTNASLSQTLSSLSVVVESEVPNSLDRTFVPPTFWPIYPMKALVQSDGHIIVAGAFEWADGFPRPHLARLNTDGRLDATFTPAPLISPDEQDDSERFVQALADAGGGRFVVLGYTAFGNGFVERILPDGRPDPGFTPPTEARQAEALAVQPDGKTLLVINGLKLVRLNPDGGMDPSFQAPAFQAEIAELTVQTDGRILCLLRGQPDHLLARFNSDGSLDATFSPRIQSNSDSLGHLLLDQDDRILLINEWPWEPLMVDGTPVGSVFRLRGDGTLDTSFQLAAGPFFINAPVTSAAADPAGGLYIPRCTPINFVHIRPDGSIDPTRLIRGAQTSEELIGTSQLTPLADGFWLTTGKQIYSRFGVFADSLAVARHDPRRAHVPGVEASATVNGDAMIFLQRLGDSSNSASVAYTTRDGTANAGTDYVPQSGEANFAPFETGKMLTIQVIGDGHLRGPRAFHFVLTSASGVSVETPEISVVIVDSEEGFAPGALKRQADGSIQLLLTSLSSLPIEASSDLKTWTQVGLQQVAGDLGTQTWLDRAASGLPQRFYRVRPSP